MNGHGEGKMMEGVEGDQLIVYYGRHTLHLETLGKQSFILQLLQCKDMIQYCYSLSKGIPTTDSVVLHMYNCSLDVFEAQQI